MSSGRIPLDEIEITGIDEYPETASVLLHGPPGTGKTTKSAARVALLLCDHGYNLSDLCWVTYRRSLADDTLERLADWDVINESELDDPSTGATRLISTIHAVANRVVGGLPEPVQSRHKRDFCDSQGLPYGTKEPWESSAGKELFACFEWLAENCYDATNEAALNYYPNKDTLREHFRGDVAEMWDAWEIYKEKHDRIDFHEMLQAVLDEGATPGTDILVIDEFHDATPLIASVAELWMQDAEIVIVAGDPHQVVNQYQGADPRFFERLEDRYPRILLNKSWRVGARHWGAATACLSRAHDPPRVEPTGTGDIHEYRSGTFYYKRESGGWQTPAPSQPASPPALVDEWGDDGDMMFLARTKMQVDGIGAALERAGVLYRSQKGLGGWNTSRGEKRLHLHNALVKIRGVRPDHFDEDDDDDGPVIVGLDHFDGKERDPSSIYLTSNEAGTLLDHIDARAGHLSQSRDQTNELVGKLRENEIAISLADFDDFVERSFWGVYTQGPASERELTAQGRSDRERVALRRALQNHDEPIDPSDIDVSVMTIHASKGQEADDVVVYDGITNTIKQEMRVNEEARKNEWRCWYVALSRAVERLHIMRGGFRWCTPIIPQDIQVAVGGQRLDLDTEEETEEVADD